MVRRIHGRENALMRIGEDVANPNQDQESGGLRHHPLSPLPKWRWGIIGSAIIVVFIFVAVFGPLLAPYPRDIGWLSDRHLSPFSTSSDIEEAEAWGVETGFHLLGTDHIGRDFLSRMLHSARPYLWVGLIGVGMGASLIRRL